MTTDDDKVFRAPADPTRRSFNDLLFGGRDEPARSSGRRWLWHASAWRSISGSSRTLARPW